MTVRFLLFAVALAGLLSVTGTRAQPPGDLPVAPAPREVRPDGSRGPVATPKAEDPSVVITRIVQNSNDVGDRLSKTDPGAETQQKQAQILKDIDSLLNSPSGGGGTGDPKGQKNPDPNQQKKNDMNAAGKGMDQQPKSDPKAGMSPSPSDPMANADPKSGGRPDRAARPRMNEQQSKADPPPTGKDDNPPKDPGTEPMAKAGGMDPKQEKEPGPMAGGMNPPTQKDKTDPTGNPMSPTGGIPNGPIRTGPPFLTDDGRDKGSVGARDKDRKKVEQFRNDKDMRGYANLLEAYYANLANAK